MCPSLAKFLDFLTGLYEQGVGYSAINTAKSAVSSFLNVSSEAPQLGNNPIVKRFMAGVFNQRPALPRYNVPWDVSVVLNYLRTQTPVRNLTLLALAQKLAMLFLLLSGHRGQSLVLLDIRNIRITKGNLKVTFGDVMKHSRPGTHTAELTLPGYAPDRRLCIVTTYSEYVLRTKSIRRSHTLFIGTIRPHSPVSKDTVAKWIKKVMSLAGIDVSIFAPHSVRSASTSAVRVPIATIVRTASWSGVGTFQKYYKKPINKSFGEGVLQLAKD